MFGLSTVTFSIGLLFSLQKGDYTTPCLFFLLFIICLQVFLLSGREEVTLRHHDAHVAAIHLHYQGLVNKYVTALERLKAESAVLSERHVPYRTDSDHLPLPSEAPRGGSPAYRAPILQTSPSSNHVVKLPQGLPRGSPPEGDKFLPESPRINAQLPGEVV